MSDILTFKALYGPSVFEWEKIKFRPGARYTSHFGITQRWRRVNNEIVWGYPRWHDGIDRSKSSVGSWYEQYGIYSPFDFERSGYISQLDSEGNVYGGQILLYSKYHFRLRICHVFDNEVDVKKSLNAGYAIPHGTFLAPAGNSGMSTGRHSHVELESWGFHGEHMESCPLIEEILEMKFRDFNEPSSEEEIISLYRNGSDLDYESMQTKLWSEKDILMDYESLLATGGITFANKYKMKKIGKNTGKISTLYSTEYVFNF